MPLKPTGKMYVGKYFTAEGYFDEDGFVKDVLEHMDKYQRKEYKEFEYNHKSSKKTKDD